MRSVLVFALCLSALFYKTTANPHSFKRVNETNSNCLWCETKITIDWDQTYQEFKGFGVFSGRAKPFYEDVRRDQLLHSLFSEDGLQLTILRSTVFPDLSFTLDFTEEQTAEIWIMKQAQKKYGVNKFIASAWSPPYKWKTRKGQASGQYMNYLAYEHYQDFANYLADFVEFYKKLGIDIYAISPQNEPEFPTLHWDGCVWWPNQTSQFVKNYLKPTFEDRGLKTKLIIGENGNWNLAAIYLSVAVSNLNENDFDIFASHGYSLPMGPSFKHVSYNQFVIPWFMKGANEKEKWITEASATDNFDPTMNKGVELSVSLCKFLTNGGISSYIFWLGMITGHSNEALIGSNGVGNLSFPRVYFVYGQYSKHIKPGYVRIKATKSFLPLLSNIHVVAFKDPASQKFSVVITNQGKQSEACDLRFQGAEIIPESIKLHLTSENYAWKIISGLLEESGSLKVHIPPMSVITVTGTAKNNLYHA
ncbi:glycosyl hydrolase-like protein [Dinothrombium tinctorium]|uniref:glucosylceramidase n=1 Tax=Dinothrombium tinctorium TaxID=1965070 RepID=A0A443QVQ4_9ACAR|nr:glycosyl hydrolase-like protein [Dinothrombium tinctorium]